LSGVSNKEVVAEERLKSIAVKQEAVDDFDEYVEAYFQIVTSSMSYLCPFEPVLRLCITEIPYMI
jgi:hypothetical protein